MATPSSPTDAQPPAAIAFDHVAAVRLESAYWTQGTWCGVVREVVQTAPPRARQYIAFCVAWHERHASEEADASEFDAYSDVIGTGRWTVLLESGESRVVDDAPVFMDGEVSWRLLGD